MAEKMRSALRAKEEAEIEKEYGGSDGISYSTLINLKSEAKNPLSRRYGTSYGTQLSPGALQAREAAASEKKYKPEHREELDAAKAKRAGREAAAEERREARGMKKGGKIKKYAEGGVATAKPEPKKDTMPEWAKNERANRKQDELNKREAEGAAKEVKRNMSTFGLKSGGSVSSASSRADGIAQRGKTRGKIC